MSDQTNSSDAPPSAAIGEIEHGPSQFEQFLEKNFKKLIALALLIILAVSAFVIMRQLGDAKAREAGNALLAAEDPDALRAVSKDYPDSASGGTAQVLLADQLWHEGKEEEAVQTLESFLSSNNDHPASSQAQFALASIAFKKGETDKARSNYEAVLNNGAAKALHPLALVALGDIAKAAGDEEKARSYYNQKIENYSNYADQNLASTRLSLVGVDAPVKVGPPEPTPTPAPALAPTPLAPVPATPATPAPEAPEAPEAPITENVPTESEEAAPVLEEKEESFVEEDSSEEPAE